MAPKFDKTTERVLRFDGKIAGLSVDLSAISDDAVENVMASLNEDAEDCAYSKEQVKAALWKFMDEEIDDLLENIEERFMNTDAKSSRIHGRFVSRREQLLGEPERDLSQERIEEAGDAKFDEARDRAMGG